MDMIIKQWKKQANICKAVKIGAGSLKDRLSIKIAVVRNICTAMTHFEQIRKM